MSGTVKDAVESIFTDEEINFVADKSSQQFRTSLFCI